MLITTPAQLCSHRSSSLRNFSKLSIAMAAFFFGGCSGAFQLHGATLGVVQVNSQQAHHTQAHHTQATASAQLQLEFFDISLEGAQDIVFVLDRSGSMSLATVGASGEEVGMTRGQAIGAEVGMALANAASGGVLPTRMDAAKQELSDALQRLPQGTRFNVVFFNEELHALSPSMMVMGPHTRSAAVRFVHSTSADGGTAAVPAMQSAYALGARHIVFLSDGLANAGGGPERLLADATAAAQRGVRVDTVGLGLTQRGEILRSMAQASGGQSVLR
ncbi:MAG: VWA domain-containing protein [Polyangiales bacterium]